ncbi:MAG: hypothetical protein QOG74_1138, partial [Alphaproteobacteria bacterium]|nr:hypothetical protein [Alphaproteobacteria bacterium]
MDVLMPQLGETVAEGKITKWFKAAGDKVAPGDNLFEIETDKVSMEVPATEPGVLTEVRVVAGEIAPVGAVVAVISASGAAVKPTPAKPATPPPVAMPAARPPAAAPAAPVAQAASAPTPRPPVALDPFHEVRTPERNYGPAKLASGVTVSPLARRLAAEAGIDLSRITASGPHGRILAKDVTDASATTPAARPAATGASAEKVKALYEPGTYEEMPLDAMRRTIAARLIEAKPTSPHVYLTADVTIERLIEVR